VPTKIHLRIDPKLCSGCLSCMTTCSFVNEDYVSLSAARLKVELNLFSATNKIDLCRQCGKAPCVNACQVNAIMLSPHASTQAWVIDYEICTGCQDCIPACPFHAIFWDSITGRVIKCELCGGEPQCVLACPTNALVLVEFQEKE